MDGQFNRFDVVQVLQANHYLSMVPAFWSEGDWNGDGWFDQADVVTAFRRAAIVPEPDVGSASGPATGRATLNGEEGGRT